MCSSKSAQYGRSLLTRRSVSSDKEAIQLATCMRFLGLELEARVVEISRGRWWMQTMNKPVKAAYFFMKAKDICRFSSCCESATWKCLTTAAASLPDLRVRLYKQEPLRVTDVANESGLGSAMDRAPMAAVYDEADEGQLQKALLEAAGILSCMGINVFEDDNGSLEKSLFLSNEACFLYYYTRTIVDARSFYSSNQRSIENLKETIINFFSAKDCIYIMLKDSIAPMKFWLHIIELSTWLEAHYSELLNAFPYTFTHDYPKCLFKKEEASLLLVCMERLQTHFAASLLCCDTPSEIIESLRIHLLQIWSDSVIQRNADFGKVTAAGKLQKQVIESTRRSDSISKAAKLITSYVYY